MPRKKVKSNQRSATSDDTQIGIRIRALRMDRKMSQQELGEKLGVSFQQVQKYEKGVNRLSVVRANDVVTALGTSMAELIGGSGKQVDGLMFDTESYKLAKVFVRLPDHMKPKLRSLINSIIGETED